MPARNKIDTQAAAHLPQPSDKEGSSTRDSILRRALELINTRGLVDFRIDTLATSLGLSPGNITYHFSRKEDICVALWEEYLDEFDKIVCSLTTLLDLKQFYLLNRIGIRLSYQYRGVAAFRNSDIGAMRRDAAAGRVNEEKHIAISRRIMELLDRNGYLNEQATDAIRNGTHTYHYTVLRWGIPWAFQNYAPEEVETKLDYLALLSIHAFYPILSEKGRKEFAEILDKVSSNDLTGSEAV